MIISPRSSGFDTSNKEQLTTQISCLRRDRRVLLSCMEELFAVLTNDRLETSKKQAMLEDLYIVFKSEKLKAENEKLDTTLESSLDNVVELKFK